MQIIKNVKKYVVITFTGGHHFITEKENEILKTLNNQRNITINSCVVHCKNIAEILTVAKYYEMYPDKRPQPKLQNFSIKDTLKKFKPVRRERAIASMMRGLKKYIDSSQNQGTGKPEKLYILMARRLKQAQADNKQI